MAANWSLLAVALCALFCSVSSNERTVQNNQQWQRLEEFHFDMGEQIEFSYNVSFPVSYSPTYLLFYKDDQYMRASQTNMDGSMKTCEQKLAVLQESSAEMYQIQFLQETNMNCSRYGDRIVCRGRAYFPGSQPRRWHAVVSRCGPITNMFAVDFTYWIQKVMPMTPFYPSAGQSELSYSVMTMASVYLMKQCLT